MRQRYSIATLPVTPWKNGGGQTREIVSLPAGSAPFHWRASIATLRQSGAFSTFPGIDRIITLIRGAEATLHHGGRVQRLALGVPYAFSGDEMTHCQMGGGEGLDFNLMTRRGHCRATVSLIAEAASSRAGVCLVMAGQWHVAGETLGQDEGMWWSGEESDVTPLSPDARLLFASVVECGQP